MTYTTVDGPDSTQTKLKAVSGTEAVGFFLTANGTGVGFTYSGTTLTDLPAPPEGSDPQPEAISGANVVGSLFASFDINTDSVDALGFVYDGANYTAILPSTARSAVAYGISGHTVVGQFQDYSGNGMYHGFLYDTGSMGSMTIEPTDAVQSSLLGIDGDEMVGNYSDSSTTYHGFVAVYQNSATVTLFPPNGDDQPTYDGTPQAWTASTDPDGLAVTITYQQVDNLGNLVGSPTVDTPINAGTYQVVGVVNDAIYSGSDTEMMVIQPEPALVGIQDQSPLYDGTPQELSVSLDPDIPFTVHYYGFDNTTGVYPNTAIGQTDGPPTDARSYSITVTVDNPNYVVTYLGGHGDLEIRQIIDQDVPFQFPDSVTVNDVITLPAESNYGFPVTYSLAPFAFYDLGTVTSQTDYATLTTPAGGVSNNILTILKQGPVTIYYYIAGDQNHLSTGQSGQGTGTDLGVDLETATMALYDLSFPANGAAHSAIATTNPSYLFADGDVTFTYADSQGNPLDSPPVDAGQYMVTATISDPNDQWQGTATGTMYIGEGYGGWEGSNFSSAQIADTSNNGAGASATPLHDATPNLLKYLCDIDPRQPMTAGGRAALPQVAMSSDGTMLVLTYRENGSLVGVTPTVQTSSDLQNWAAPTNAIMSQTNDADPIITVEVPVTITNGQPSQFLRLSVTIQ